MLFNIIINILLRYKESEKFHYNVYNTGNFEHRDFKILLDVILDICRYYKFNMR